MIRMEVWGPYACFNRMEFKTEKVTYPVMTPSAARGVVESVFWHPGLRYIIDRIYVLAPIRYTNIRRNEVKSTLSAAAARTALTSGKGKLALYTPEDIQQRAAMVLQDVHYVIEAHFVLTEKANPSDNPGKFQDILRRRLARGQCYSQPYLGCREFPAHFREWPADLPISAQPINEDLSFMLYDLDYSDPQNIRPQFFRAKLVNGVLDLRDCEVIA